MKTDAHTPPSHRRQTPREEVPDRVTVPTPSGHLREGEVVDHEWDASVAGLRRILVVEVDGSRIRAYARRTSRVA